MPIAFASTFDFLFLWAKKNETMEAISSILIIVFSVGALIYYAGANIDVTTRNGVPYCPRCNRQVSMRRAQCRSCGYNFVSYGPTPAEKAAETARAIASAARIREAMEAEDERRATEAAAKLAEEAARKNARDEAYRAKGVEPGPFAWFLAWYNSQPDLYQALAIGVLLAIPASVVVAIMLMFMGT